MSFGGGSSGPSAGEIDAKARVKAAEERARVTAEEEFKSKAANEQSIADKIQLSESEAERKARQSSLLALSTKEQLDNEKKKTNNKVTLLGQ